MNNLLENKKFHFIGMGGIGMSGLAKILLEAGYQVSGSDLHKNHLTQYLESKGALAFEGHCADNITDCEVVVVSTAIRETNPEYKKAKDNNIPIMHRAELLKELISKAEYSIGVTGTHGKTTTTGMITTIFHEMGLTPGFAIGGEVPQLKTNAAYGKGKYFVAELDESDGTIELHTPNLCVITNLEFEHPDHYTGGFEQLLDTFVRFIEKLSSEAKVIINIDDDGNKQLLNRLFPDFFQSQKYNAGKMLKQVRHDVNFITYSMTSKEADYYSDNEGNFHKKGEFLGKIKLNVPGIHNISNAIGALAAAMESGLDINGALTGLSKFLGMKKRFQTLGFANGVQIVDDYAHHPTEIKATLQAARTLNPARIIAVFQPHRYTRFASLWNDFLKCFDEADILYVCDVYSAEEDPIQGVSSEEFSKQLQHKAAYYIKGELNNAAQAVISEMKQGDIVLTMGAGTITKLGGIILDKTTEK